MSGGGWDAQEVTVYTTWPSVASIPLGPFPVGRWLGQLYSIDIGLSVLTIGNLICLLSIPIAIVLYFARVLPFIGTRYRITSHRIVVERGLTFREDRSIDLDRFDNIDIEVAPGYAWFNAGDLVFRLDKTETFRLTGVSRPEAMRAICMKAHTSYAGVRRAMEAQGLLATAG